MPINEAAILVFIAIIGTIFLTWSAIMASKGISRCFSVLAAPKFICKSEFGEFEKHAPGEAFCWRCGTILDEGLAREYRD